MPSSATARIYSYPGRVVLPRYFVLGLAFLVYAAPLVLVASSGRVAHAFGKIPVATQVLLLAIPFIWVAGLIGTAAAFRPLTIDATGITTWLFGSPLKSLMWRDIRLIEKRYLRQRSGPGFYVVFMVRAENRTISFRGELGDVNRFLAEMNKYIQEYRIEVAVIDWRADTLQAALHTVSDSMQRRDIIRNGIRSRASQL